MIVKCKNGHEFDDSESWECPACYAERAETIEARFERDLDADAALSCASLSQQKGLGKEAKP